MTRGKYKVEINIRGDKTWYLNSHIHRKGKPAIEYYNSDPRCGPWLLNGRYYTYTDNLYGKR